MGKAESENQGKHRHDVSSSHSRHYKKNPNLGLNFGGKEQQSIVGATKQIADRAISQIVSDAELKPETFAKDNIPEDFGGVPQHMARNQHN